MGRDARSPSNGTLVPAHALTSADGHRRDLNEVDGKGGLGFNRKHDARKRVVLVVFRVDFNLQHREPESSARTCTHAARYCPGY